MLVAFMVAACGGGDSRVVLGRGSLPGAGSWTFTGYRDMDGSLCIDATYAGAFVGCTAHGPDPVEIAMAGGTNHTFVLAGFTSSAVAGVTMAYSRLRQRSEVRATLVSVPARTLRHIGVRDRPFGIYVVSLPPGASRFCIIARDGHRALVGSVGSTRFEYIQRHKLRPHRPPIVRTGCSAPG